MDEGEAAALHERLLKLIRRKARDNPPRFFFVSIINDHRITSIYISENSYSNRLGSFFEVHARYTEMVYS